MLSLCAFCTKTYAYESYDTVLDKTISADGIFDGANGVVFADKICFSENPSLLIVSVNNNSVICKVYDDTDGMQCTDILTVPYAQHGNYILSVATFGKKNFLMLQINNDTGFYTISDDMFSQIENFNYEYKTDIISISAGKITAYKTRRELYNFLNSLKKQRIDGYRMPNLINTVSDSEKSGMMNVIKACADVMHFDIQNYDYDKVVKYILCSNQNFKLLTDIPSNYIPDSGGISIVGTEYIDFILKNIFDLPPEHPEVNLLTRRGFCVDGGYYYYKNNFGYYATDILETNGIYDLGNDMHYIVFSDMFRYETSAVPEYSYAVLKNTSDGYKLIKLGMGENLLFERELYELSPQMKNSYAWENTASPHQGGNFPCIILFMVCISCGAAALICGIIYIIREVR